MSVFPGILAKMIASSESTDHMGKTYPKMRFAHDLFDIPAIGTPMRFSQLILDVGAFRPAGFATQEEMLFPRSIRADKLPPIRNAVVAGITPTSSEVHIYLILDLSAACDSVGASLIETF